MNNLQLLITKKDKWVSDQGTFRDGVNEPFPVVMRYRLELQEFIDSKLYDTRLMIIWRYEVDNPSLMPTPELHQLMCQVEDSLTDSLEKDALGILAIVWTGGGTREWHWYTQDINETAHRINEALAQYDVLPIELIQVIEPDWKEYLNVLAGNI